MEEKIIRSAAMRDIDKMKELWTECFPDDIEYSEFFFQNIFSLSCAFVCEIDGEIAAMLHAFPYDFATPEGDLKAKYIYGVGTAKKFRSRGIAGELLMKGAEDCDFAVLIPQNESLFDFYEKYGYKIVFNAIKAERPNIDKFRCAKKEDIPRLNDIYENAFRGYIHPKRDNYKWELLIKEYGFLGGGVAIGDGSYCAYYKAGGEYKISELCPQEGESFKIGIAKLVSQRAKEIFSKGYKTYLNLMHN